MSAFKFECPSCGQHLQGDETYSGRQLNCPNCQHAMTVPNPAASAPAIPPPPVQVAAPPSIRVAMPTPVAAAPPPPQPPAQGAMRITAHAATATSPGGPPPAAPRHLPTPMPMPKFDGDDDEPGSRKKKKKIISIAVLVAVALLAGFVLIPRALKWQKSFNDKQARDDDPGVIGGQVSHVMELNNVLDATDPDKMGRNADRGPAAAMAGRARKARAMSVDSAGGAAAMEAGEGTENLPAIPATWTLDAAAAQIPNGRVAGTVAGASFTADHVFLLMGGATPVLAFRQGLFQNPDRELIVYPKLKPGQTLENQTWTITAEQTADVPQVAKRWKAAPNTAPQMKPFPSGYVLKLEFGRMTPGGLPGKIYLALPDTEHSVAGGVFVAGIRAAGAPTARRPGAGGQPSMMSDE